jgi:hypothetical protein
LPLRFLDLPRSRNDELLMPDWERYHHPLVLRQVNINNRVSGSCTRISSSTALA